jgi:hypothetical protein
VWKLIELQKKENIAKKAIKARNKKELHKKEKRII